MTAGAVATLSNFTYPLGITHENAVGNAPSPSFIAVAPDAAHLAVAIRQIVPFSTEYDPYIVDVSTHAVIKVPLSTPITTASEGSPRRLFTWADNHTLVLFEQGGSDKNTYGFNIQTGALTQLHGIQGALEGVARCGTLFYETLGAAALVSSSDPNHATAAPTLIHRYNLATSVEIGTPLNIGDATTSGGSEGVIDRGGWDASRDGTKLVYQHETATFTNNALKLSSQWFAASADGSNATAILPHLTSNTGAFMSIAPNGQVVAVTNANPSPNVVSGPLPGSSSSIEVFYDAPSATGLPAWYPYSNSFYATGGQDYSPAGLEVFTLGTASHATGTVIGPGVFPASLP